MAGFIPVGSRAGISSVYADFLSGATLARYDSVKLSSGELALGTAGDALVGVNMEESVTNASEGVQVDITPYMLVIADNDGVGGAATVANVGEYADLIGATGAQLIDTSTFSTTVATFRMTELNPQGYGFDSDTSIGLFEIAERA